MSLARNINTWLERLNKSAAEVASAAGKDPTTIYKLVSGENQEARSKTLKWIALGMSRASGKLITKDMLTDADKYKSIKLLNFSGDKEGDIAGYADSDTSGQIINKALTSSPSVNQGARTMPVFGQKKPSSENIDMDFGATDSTPYPPDMEYKKDAFAVPVFGDSMKPRWKTGEIVYIAPYEGIASGDDVAVELNDGSLFLRELVKQTETGYILLQYNPLREYSLESSAVRRVMPVVFHKARR